ncbi:MAG: gamma-glutamyltransferase [Gammaproteobacteria bacterium]|nr:gamma-glutamyltransferase [Gammaproteobacteria bacterium]
MFRTALAVLSLFLLPQAYAADVGIASAHPLADEAGYEILAKGGNAFDAAIAVSAALSVTEPYSSGIGGGGFYLLHRARDGHEVMIDGRETAPAAATPAMYLDADGNLVSGKSVEGVLAAAIPGTPAALALMAEKYGELPLAVSLAPAIRLAREGFKVDERFAAMTEDYRDRLLRHCVPDCPFLVDDDDPLPAGEILRQPELAAVLERLAADKGESFYRGEDAEAMVAEIRERGGIWTEDDLAAYEAKVRDVLKGDYRGHRITTATLPSSGGITLLETLNILEGFRLEKLSQADRMHVIAEAWRRAYRDRNEYLGDPDFETVPRERLLHPHYAAGLRASIRMDEATPSNILPPVVPREESEHTTHFSIIDAEGNRVAATQTVNFRFGSGVVANGITLNNEMNDFSVKPGAPNGFGLVQGWANAVEGGKRPLSSMTPTFIESDRGVAVLGTPGGSRIISMVTLGVLDWVNGGDAKSMVSLPRFHHQYLPDYIDIEKDAFSEALRAALRVKGHDVKEASRRWGNMNIVTRDRDGEVDVAHDPRNEARVAF